MCVSVAEIQISEKTNIFLLEVVVGCNTTMQLVMYELLPLINTLLDHISCNVILNTSLTPRIGHRSVTQVI